MKKALIRSLIFEGVAAIEKEHDARYKTLLANVENETVFEKPKKVQWICRNCGHIHEGTTAPKVCPVCAHPLSYFEVRSENY